MSVAEAEVKMEARARWSVGPRVVPLAAAALLVASLFLPYWQLTLHAPQYPGGLRARVYLTHVAGDAEEIDTLNHYIGMRSLRQAASLERRLAVPLVLLVAALLLASAYVPPVRSAARLLLRLPVLLLPVGVVTDLAYWLWQFGHSLDLTAPIRVVPFTPPIIGRGMVMQFATTASFGVGMLLAAAAAGLALYDLVRRERTR